MCGQSVSFGVKAGVPVTDAFAAISDSRYSVGTQRWTAGVTAELSLPASLSVGADLLYRRFSYAYFDASTASSSASNIGHFELPVYAKYSFGGHLARPFVEAGFEFDLAHTSTAFTSAMLTATVSGASSSSQWGAGVLLGGGIEIKVPFLKIAPELRYMRWQKGVFHDPPSTAGGSETNQIELLVGVRF